MEIQNSLSPKPIKDDYSSKVDTSRPFRSVKEAVAIFGERIVLGEMYSPNHYYTPPSHENSWIFSSIPPSPEAPKEDKEQDNEFLDNFKKLEAELEETRAELKLLKERESETEIALASLNAELHVNMSKIAEAEAAAAANKAVLATRSGREKKEDLLREEEKRRELTMRLEHDSPTLAQILSLAEERVQSGSEKERKMMTMTMKKKPIVPLVGDLFFKKKGSSHNSNPLYASLEKLF